MSLLRLSAQCVRNFTWIGSSLPQPQAARRFGSFGLSGVAPQPAIRSTLVAPAQHQRQHQQQQLVSSAPSATAVLKDILSRAILQIKRTFQPSVIRKKRKTGFLVRQRTVGGRKMLKRRTAKGRWRLGGGI